MMLVVTVGIAMIYAFCDQVVNRTGFGPMPLIVGAVGMSILSAIVTRERFLAPLTCLLPSIAAGLVVVYGRGWGYADMHFFVPFFMAASVPAWLIAMRPRRTTAQIGQVDRRERR